MSLDILIGPDRKDVFFREIWEREPLHVARNDPDYFAFLRKDLPIEQIIWQTCHNWGEVSLARTKTSYESAPYAAMPPTISTIRRAFTDEYTIVINNLEKKSIRAAKFCRDFEKDCYFNSIINLYYTKANSQGLDSHYDTEDVFILQLEGAKEWRIYDKKSDLPLADAPYEHLDYDSNSSEVYNLCPGDVLYIPRGFVHDAQTRNLDSIHLTLTVSVMRWASLLQQLIDVAANDNVEFRKALPIDLVKMNDPAFTQSVVSGLLHKMSDPTYLAATVSEIQNRLLVAKQRLPTDALNVSLDDELRLESEVSIAADQVYVLSQVGEGLSLKFIGASVEVSPDLEAAINFICERKSFFVHELPESLVPAEKLALVRRLVECEFLAVKKARQVSIVGAS